MFVAPSLPALMSWSPKLSDTPEAFQEKINRLRQVLTTKYQTETQTYQQGGYDPFMGQVDSGNDINTDYLQYYQW